MTNNASPRLLTLDAMRGIAAILVMLYHLNSEGAYIFPSGYLAVDFFFLLSGFVIARTYDSRLAAGMTFFEFAALRAIRLYPLILVGLLLGFIRCYGQILLQRPDRMSMPDLAVSVAFGLLSLPSPAANIISPLNGPAWSLFFEMAVNLVYAALLIKARLRVLVFVTSLCAALVGWEAVAHGSMGFGFKWTDLHGGVARVGFSFTLGIIVARLHRKLPTQGAWAMVPMVILAAMLSVDARGGSRIAYDLFCVTVASPLLVWFGASCNPPRALQHLSARLGDLSYPIYAIHYPVVFMAGYTARKLGAPHEVWMPLFAMGIVTAAWVLDRFYDKPVRRRLNDWLRRARVPKASSTGDALA